MNLSIDISGQTPNKIKVSIRLQSTGRNCDTPESIRLHRAVCDLLEPAVYNAVKGMVERGLLQQAEILWDNQVFRIKNK